jgi:type III pantothenate kinase
MVFNQLISEDFEQKTQDVLERFPIKNAILSSVINHPQWVENNLKFFNGVILNSSTKLPISINYTTPNTLGNDRIANAVALSVLYPKQNSLSIDIGTCIKYDMLSENNAYLGGGISPGFGMRLKAMHGFTDKLPLVEKSIPVNLIGDSTESSLLSGAYFGALAEMKEIINSYKLRFPNLNVVATGGDLYYFEKELKNSIFANAFLTLVGLNEILNYNVQ